MKTYIPLKTALFCFLTLLVSNSVLAQEEANPVFEDPNCMYRLYFAHEPEVGSKSLYEVVLMDDGTAVTNHMYDYVNPISIGLEYDGLIFQMSNGAALQAYDIFTGTFAGEAIKVKTAEGNGLEGVPALCVDSSGVIYAAHEASNQIYTIDYSGLALPYGPSYPVNSGDLVHNNGELWLFNYALNRVTNVSTGIYHNLPLYELFAASALPNGNFIVADGESSKFFEIDASTFTIVNTYISELMFHEGDLAGKCSVGLLYLGAHNRDASVLQSEQAVQKQEGHLELWPNPSREQVAISFELDRPGEYKLELYDMKGRLVKVLNRGSLEANEAFTHHEAVGHLSAGVYLCRLSTPFEVVQKKLFVD